MQFYVGDWLKDPAVRACSLAARGLWTDLLCLMWESPERGVLKTGEQAWGVQEIASAVGADVTLVAKLMAELKGKGVTSARAGDGSLYSRRMVRDEAERQKEKERQRRHRGYGRDVGGGLYDREEDRSVADRNLPAEGGNDDSHGVTAPVTDVSRGSSSSSSASTSSSNLRLNFTGACNGKSEPNARLADRQVSKPQTERKKDTRLEALRLQAEILGRQERLSRHVNGGPSGAGGGPVAAAFGVRAKAEAIERARRLEAEIHDKQNGDGTMTKRQDVS
jgi:hypothetical protein